MNSQVVGLRKKKSNHIKFYMVTWLQKTFSYSFNLYSHRSFPFLFIIF